MKLTKKQFNNRLNLKAEMIRIRVNDIKGLKSQRSLANQSIFVLGLLKICYKLH